MPAEIDTRPKIDIAGLLARSASLYLTHPRSFLCIALVSAPLHALFLLGPSSWLLSELLSLIGIVGFDLVFAALTYAAAGAVAGAQPRFAASYRAVAQRFWTIIGVTLRTLGVVVLLAVTIVGIPFAVRTLVRWLFGIQAAMLRDLPAKRALDLSAHVVKGLWWQVFATLAITLLLSAPLSVVAFMVGFGILHEAFRFAVAAAGLVLFPLWACFWTLVFLDLLARESARPASS